MKVHVPQLLASVLLMSLISSEQALAQSKIYTANFDTIQRANLDGSDAEDVITLRNGYTNSMAVDTVGGKLYWIDFAGHVIQRANVDGSEVEDLVNLGLRSASDIALDIARGKMYWSDGAAIHRANVDGTEVEVLVTLRSGSAHDIALDVAHGKLYWINFGEHVIQRANLDGGEIEDIVGGREPGIRRFIALDVAGGHMYWVNSISQGRIGASIDTIQRAKLDGGAVEDVVTVGTDFVTAFALDVAERTMYWFTCGLEAFYQRTTLDGGEIENLTTSLKLCPGDMALTVDVPAIPPVVQDPVFPSEPMDEAVARSKVYWTSARTDAIKRANFDGSQIEDVVPVFARSVKSFAVDPVGRHLYWASSPAGVIQRANFDGTGVENILLGFSRAPTALVVDALGRKIYWSDEIQVFRADLDGSGVEVIVPGFSFPGPSFALDPIAEKLYWVKVGTIHRANLDGSGDEVLASGVRIGRIVLEASGGKIYWPEGGVIRRANLNGSGVTDIISAETCCVGTVVLDVADGKMYWSEGQQRNVIRRANLDGSGAAIVLSSTPNVGFGVDSGTIYVTNSLTIIRADIDDGEMEDLFPNVNARNGDIALDVPASKMYWIGSGGTIRSADLDGSNARDVFLAAAIDPSGSLVVGLKKLYWIDAINDGKTVWRADLNDGEIEDLFSPGTINPHDIALDTVRGKLYWTNCDERTIKRANLNGDGIEDLAVPDVNCPNDIVLDVVDGKMYWTFARTIRRANLDGSEIENVINLRSGHVNDVALDIAAGKLYWTNSDSGAIERSNLDGSEIEECLIDLGGVPFSMALAIEQPVFLAQLNAITHRKRTIGDGLVAPIHIQNIGPAAPVEDVALALWASDDMTLDDENDRLLVETTIDRGSLLPGQDVVVKLREKALDPIDGKFAIVTVEQDVKLMKMIGGRGCSRDATKYEIEPNTPDAPQAVGTISVARCVTVEGTIDGAQDVDGYRLNVKGGQTLNIALTHTPDAEFVLDVSNGMSGQLDCETPTTCTLVVPTLNTTGIAEIDLSLVPVRGMGTYTLDIFSQ